MYTFREILDSPNLLIYAFVISLLTIELVFIRLRCKKYEKDIKKAGRELIVLEPSKDFALTLNSGYIAVLILLVVDIKANSSFKLLYVLVIAVMLISMKFKSKTQKICENGILISTGLVEWKSIESVESINEMSERIIIHLKEKVNGVRHITLYCVSEKALDIEQLVERNCMRENNDF